VKLRIEVNIKRKMSVISGDNTDQPTDVMFLPLELFGDLASALESLGLEGTLAELALTNHSVQRTVLPHLMRDLEITAEAGFGSPKPNYSRFQNLVVHHVRNGVPSSFLRFVRKFTIEGRYVATKLGIILLKAVIPFVVELSIIHNQDFKGLTEEKPRPFWEAFPLASPALKKFID
jgi:hypothetical protein